MAARGKWAGGSMLKVVLLQVLAVLMAAALAGIPMGAAAALSVLAGGLAYLLPNLLFVLRLQLAVAARSASAASFLAGEVVKLSVVVALLVVLPRVMEVNWPALIAGLFVVWFVNLFALLLKT